MDTTKTLSWLLPGMFGDWFRLHWGVAAMAVVSAYGAYSANENAEDQEEMQREAMDRSDPFGLQRGEYTQGLRDTVNAGNTSGQQAFGMTPQGAGGINYLMNGMPAPTPGPDYSNLNNLAQNIQNNPSYQFRMEQGMQNVGRQASVKGMLASGNYLKDLTDYAQGLASTEYDAEYQRQFSLTNQRFANTTQTQSQAFSNATLAEQQAQDRFNRYALLTGAQNVMPGSAITAASQNAFGYNAQAQDNAGRLGGGLYNAYTNYQANQAQTQVPQTVQNSGGGY